MKLLIILGVVAVVAAAPPPTRGGIRYSPDGDVQILRYDNDNAIDSYRFGFEQSDGTRRDEEGSLKNQGREDEALSMKGSYSWVGPDGVTYTVTYIADDNGYQPEIEQGPGGGVPPAVVASLLG